MAGHHHHNHHPVDHDHEAGGARPTDPVGWIRRNIRFVVAGVIVVAVVLSATLVLVPPGDAIVITRFGKPVRVLTQPGLALKLPAPIESTIDVNLRLRTTPSGLHDVGTRDGLRIIVQAYIAWQVRDDAQDIRQFLRAVRNQPDIAATQLRSFVGSNLEITASSFDLANLVNTDRSKIELDRFESNLRQRIDRQALHVYGITVTQVGLERLTLPEETLNATINRMRAERMTVATEETAEGHRAAAKIESDAARDSQVIIAKAHADAAAIEAKSRVKAADIYRKAYDADPQLYMMLRSFDTLHAVVNKNTRLILRTDSAPFQVLVNGPNGAPCTVSQSEAKR
ncbi:MAG TPA: SPFH domain-containing protein [Stellaceae bacterium]|nr:SPFH domain-containing protein [Stellaceae bacterium]